MKKILILVIETPPEGLSPPGSVGKHFRLPFVGCRIPLAPEEVLKADPPSAVLMKEFREGDHIVLLADAIEALDASGSRSAVDFWRRNNSGRYLLFKQEVCQVVK